MENINFADKYGDLFNQKPELPQYQSSGYGVAAPLQSYASKPENDFL